MMDLLEIAKKTDSILVGKNKNINKICSIERPSLDGICYVSKPNMVSQKLLSNIGAILTDNLVAINLKNHSVLVSEKPKLSFAKLTRLFSFNSSNLTFNKDLKIYVGKDFKKGKNFKVGAGVVIEDSVTIGNNVTLNHNVVISAGSVIGNNVIIGPGTIIGSEGFGNVYDDKNWVHLQHLGSVLVEDNVLIGANCTIDRGTLDRTIIRNGVIIDNQVHIAHNVEIGENTAIAANTGIAGSCFIGKRNLIGGMVGIIDHITTADDVIISATSTVNKNLKEPGVYTGIMPISKHTNWKRIALWITKLDKIAKLIDIKKI